jgi:hypothetical protein
VGNGGSNNGGSNNANTGSSTASETCEQLPASGGVIDDGDDCFEAGGPSQYLRAIDEGNDGDSLWTGTTANASPVNFGVWNVKLAQAGDYSVDVYVVGDVATSQKAKYAITHAGVTSTVMFNQTGGNRWVNIGTWAFTAGGGQRIRANDNTGESSSLARKLVFDAVRLTRVVPQPAADCPYLEVSTSGGPLNVRRQPNTSHDPVGTLANGAVVQRLETVQGQTVSGTSEWHRITSSNVTGYVSAAFTTCRDTP